MTAPLRICDTETIVRQLHLHVAVWDEQVGLEVCAGLKAIHELDVIHRDLKVVPFPLDDLELLKFDTIPFLLSLGSWYLGEKGIGMALGRGTLLPAPTLTSFLVLDPLKPSLFGTMAAWEFDALTRRKPQDHRSGHGKSGVSTRLFPAGVGPSSCGQPRNSLGATCQIRGHAGVREPR